MKPATGDLLLGITMVLLGVVIAVYVVLSILEGGC